MKITRIRWWLAATLLSAAVALVVWRCQQPGALDQRLARYRAAGQPTTLAELDAYYTAVPDAENAATALSEAIGAWRSVADTNLPTASNGPRYPRRGEPWPAPMLTAARAELAANAEPLADLHAALARPRSRYPVNLRAGVNLALAHLSPLKKTAQTLCLKARFAAETGDPTRAADALLDSLRAARTLEEEPLLISYLVRIAMNAITMDATEGVLSRAQLSEAQLAALQQGFVAAEATNHLSRAFIGERCLASDYFNLPTAQLARLVAAPAGGPATSPTGWEGVAQAAVSQLYELSGLKGRDRAYHFDRLDELIEAGARPRTEMPQRQAQFDAELQRFAARRTSILLPVSRMTLPSLTKAPLKELRSVATLRCVQAGMAVERWRLTHGGALPPSLDALVPKFLAAVPTDPMDGQPVRFRALAKGYVIYSFGEDGKDDGGMPFGDRPKKRDGSYDSTVGWDYTFTVAR